MTFEQMHSEAELLYESINSSAAPGFTDAEWAQLLTIGQRKVVLRILNEGINKNTFNQMALEKLVQSDVYTAFTDDTYFRNADGTFAKRLDPSVKVFESKFFWMLDEYVSTGTRSVTNIPVKHITYDYYRINLDNSYRTPSATEGYWILQNNTDPLLSESSYPVFITDGIDVTEYCVIGVYHPDNYPIESGTTYPSTGTQASILGEGAHYKIVEEAVTLARMSVTDPQGYQLSLAEFAK
jgi:hypothetical protein